MPIVEFLYTCRESDLGVPGYVIQKFEIALIGASGQEAEVSMPSGDFMLLPTGDLSTNGNPGPVTLDFDTLIYGLGSTSTPLATGDYTAIITASDINGNLLGSFSAPAPQETWCSSVS